MNGLENISKKILEEAEAEAAALLAEADAQAAEIIEKARDEAARMLEEGRKAIEAGNADSAERARLAAGLEHRRLLATTRQDMIAEAFSKALDRLVNLPEEKYRGLLISLAEKALADGEGGELLFSARDRAAHGGAVVSAVKAKHPSVSLSEDTAAIPGGLVVRRGKIELNCALDVSVRMLTGPMAFEVGSLLFPEGE